MNPDGRTGPSGEPPCPCSMTKPRPTTATTPGTGRGLSLKAIGEHLVELMGGERAVAKILFTEFTEAPARGKKGSAQRDRILGIILRLIQSATDDGEDVDLGLLSEADLERRLAHLMQGHNGSNSKSS